jgi:hypothetical protein
MAKKKLGSTKLSDEVLNTSANLATEVTGTLPVTNGGTGQTVYTNGQLLIGNTTGNTLTKATLTPGAGISITNGAGSITIASTGGTGDVVGDDTTTTVQNIVAYNTTGGKNITELTGTQGDVLYHNGTSWAKLPAGTSGNFLKTNGAGANPAWAAASVSAANVTAGTFPGVTYTFSDSIVVTGDVTVDTNLLVTDSTNNRIGINQATPLYALDVTGTQRVTGTTTFNGLTYTWPATQTASYYLQTNGSGTLSWAAAGGGSDPWTYEKLTADYTTTSATLGTIAAGSVQLLFTPAANTHYEFEAMLMLRTSTATNNPRTGVAWPTGMNDGVVFMNQTGAASTTGVYTAGNIGATVQVAVGGLPNNTQAWPCFIKGVLSAGASPSGQLRIQMAAETAGGTMTVETGSFLKYRTI